jgi:hypothetical protein
MGERFDATRSAAGQKRAQAAGRMGAARAGAASRYGQAKGSVYAKSADLRARLSEGTEHMSEQARARVMGARTRAAEAQARIEQRGAVYRDQGYRFYEEQPLMVGAIVMGIGALIGAALPRTHRENELIGGYRDQAFDEAERVFREEAAKARAVAEAAVHEAQDVAREKTGAAKSKVPSGEEAVDKAEAEARGAVNRVADAAKSEAEKQDLGGSLN